MDSNVVDVFNFKHVLVVDKMSLLGFIPKAFNPRMEPQKVDKKLKRQSIDVTAAKASAVSIVKVAKASAVSIVTVAKTSAVSIVTVAKASAVSI